MTSWHRNEYILKGLFLGLWAFFALQVPPARDAALRDIGWVVGWVGVGLLVGLAGGTVMLLSRGLRPWQNWGAFPLAVLLESPTFIYGGIVAGLSVGVLSGSAGAEGWAAQLAAQVGLTHDDIRHQGRVAGWLGYCALGGAVLGFGMLRLREEADPWRRFLLAGVVGIAGAYLMTDYGSKYLAQEAVQDMALAREKAAWREKAAAAAAAGQPAPPEPQQSELRRKLDEGDTDTRKEYEHLAAGVRALAAEKGLTGEQEAALRKWLPGTDKDPNAAVTAAKNDYSERRESLGLYLLLALPFFYLLVFSGDADESVVEVAAFNAVLGAGLFLVDLGGKFLPSGTVAIVLPLAVYFTYATRVQPGLRVFKHVLRGYAYLNVGRLRDALYFFRRALELDPEHELARKGMVHLHNSLSLPSLESDPELAEVLDFTLCLDRAAALLQQPPTPQQLAEANRLLDLVETKKPGLQGRVDYLRAVALAHAKNYDAAAEVLTRLLNPETPYPPTVRRRSLFRAWVLAVKGPAEVVRRVGWDELRKPGRRVEAIQAVERELADSPNDMTAKELKAVLYSQLTEPEFVAASTQQVPADVDYDYVEQLGLALVDDPDPERRDRGVGYLRIAGRGNPARGPGVFRKLAQAAERVNDRETMVGYLEQAKRSVAAAGGVRELTSEQKEIYLAGLRRLSDEYEAKGDAVKRDADAAKDRGDRAAMQAKDAEARPFYEYAIDQLRLYLDGGGRAELDTYRKLAEIYAKARAIPHAVINALLNAETGLTYSSTDADLLKKKDSYYYSVDADELARLRDRVKGYFDVSYCVRKAMTVLNAKDESLDLVEWAAHLAKLARIMQPTNNGVRLVEARCMLRTGQREEGVRIMENIRAGRRGSGEEEEAWFAATKILGQLYLEELDRPRDALRCFLDYKEYIKSGADTLYQIARCYEATGDAANALRFYEAVTAYEEHPRGWDAKEAIKRLRGQ